MLLLVWRALASGATSAGMGLHWPAASPGCPCVACREVFNAEGWKALVHSCYNIMAVFFVKKQLK